MRTSRAMRSTETDMALRDMKFRLRALKIAWKSDLLIVNTERSEQMQLLILLRRVHILIKLLIRICFVSVNTFSIGHRIPIKKNAKSDLLLHF